MHVVYDKPTTAPPLTPTKTDSLISSVLATLLPALVANFQNVLTQLDLELTETFTTQIRELNEPLANAIATFTNNFQYE
ncbi:MAG TPA: hypothetical protein V6C91_11170 [Coleofasciculaceae cyanobacterium]